VPSAAPGTLIRKPRRKRRDTKSNPQKRFPTRALGSLEPEAGNIDQDANTRSLMKKMSGNKNEVTEGAQKDTEPLGLKIISL